MLEIKNILNRYEQVIFLLEKNIRIQGPKYYYPLYEFMCWILIERYQYFYYCTFNYYFHLHFDY